MRLRSDHFKDSSHQTLRRFQLTFSRRQNYHGFQMLKVIWNTIKLKAGPGTDKARDKETPNDCGSTNVYSLYRRLRPEP